MVMPVYNNDQDYDAMFAQAEVKRKEPEISISMTHAGDDNSQVQRKKHKIRIGESSDQDDGESLNNEQSKQYAQFMEKRYSTEITQMTSNFGQNYMKQ
jgi:hypothetical protein